MHISTAISVKCIVSLLTASMILKPCFWDNLILLSETGRYSCNFR